MSKILFINSVCNGSTGMICKNLYKAAKEAGHECCIAYGRGNAPEGYNTIRIGNKLDFYLHVLKARIFDASGFGSKHATKEFIKRIEEFKPDIIHLHNIHGYYVNIEILFKYLKDHPEIKKIWTLHDCWAFTGHCAYYTYVKCNKWQTCCKGNCSNREEYPRTVFSNVESNFNKKKEVFSDIENMILITPSKWLKKEVKKSYLKNYQVMVINNGVDTNVFKATPSDIKKQYNIENKKVILGVASVWDKRKGLDTFIELSKQLNNEYQIVLIGLNKKQIKTLPKNIVGISRTENIQELVKWYSAAEVFFNASIEETFGMTTVEAMYCGTPAIVFNYSALPEIIGNNGIVLENEDILKLKNIIGRLEEKIIINNMNYSLNITYKKHLILYEIK
ncbi:processive diacylglycerol alpha-glucosyltransferase [Thomasclavelia cocleata]|uniref:Processive diacylglycerol alpha-glucosyltransferase n=1 Tax=Thomasclavelia cocleata TaxID=69824 RepID=A0A829Z7L7_9FIRM|nr:glycosyltransferase [Thomasclavelia cocleata]GFI40413.1 processive diacylglycerol alpha-glucosyltransferase [Thomasclavelia cocleata]